MEFNRGFGFIEMLVVMSVVSVVGATSIGYYHAAKVRQLRQTVKPMPNRSVQRTITVQLGSQGGSGRSGTAVLAEIDGKVKVVVSLSGPSGGVSRPAHIHSGSCPDVGAVKYPLTSLAEGASQTNLEVSLDELVAQSPLAINIHKSSEEPSIYLACGDIDINPGMMRGGVVPGQNFPGQGMMGR